MSSLLLDVGWCFPQFNLSEQPRSYSNHSDVRHLAHATRTANPLQRCTARQGNVRDFVLSVQCEYVQTRFDVEPV